MNTKTALITGATGGIGSETARELARRGFSLILACRNEKAARTLCAEISREPGAAACAAVRLDLASRASVRACAQHLLQDGRPLDVLINNAGIFTMKREETVDGFEKTMAINFLGPYLFTRLLEPLLLQAPAARILNITSNAGYQGRIILDDLHSRRKFHGFRAYSASKLALVLFTRELAERLRATPVTVNAVHPGTVSTGIWNIWPGAWYQNLLSAVTKRLMMPAAESGRSVAWCAADESLGTITGAFFDQTRQKPPPPRSLDRDLQKKLWDVAEQMTGAKS